MVTKGWAPIGVDLKFVLAPGVIGVRSLVSSRTGEGNELMASLMNHKTANLALKSLFPKSPDEVGAVAAEGGLLEEARDEFVLLHLVHVLLPQGPFASKAPRRVRGRAGLGAREHVGHGSPLYPPGAAPTSAPSGGRRTSGNAAAAAGAASRSRA